MAGKPNWVKNENGSEVNLGGFGIPCLFCHTMSEKGRHSTVPSLDICMKCHNYVGHDKEGVIKLREYWDKRIPVKWRKIYNLPDFIYTSHYWHLKANRKSGVFLKCVDCHGEVEKMKSVTVQSSLKMGWCVDCHKEAKVYYFCMVCHK